MSIKELTTIQLYHENFARALARILLRHRLRLRSLHLILASIQRSLEKINPGDVQPVFGVEQEFVEELSQSV